MDTIDIMGFIGIFLTVVGLLMLWQGGRARDRLNRRYAVREAKMTPSHPKPAVGLMWKNKGEEYYAAPRGLFSLTRKGRMRVFVTPDVGNLVAIDTWTQNYTWASILGGIVTFLGFLLFIASRMIFML